MDFSDTDTSGKCDACDFEFGAELCNECYSELSGSDK